MPPARAHPWTLAIGGLTQVPHLLEQRSHPAPRIVVVEEAVGAPARPFGRHARQVGAGTEGLIARPGEDHHPHTRVVLGRFQLPAQPGDDRPTSRHCGAPAG